MSLSILKRAKPSAIDPAYKRVIDSMDKLQYAGLRTEYKRLQFQRILSECGIVPFEQESVNKYKALERKKAMYPKTRWYDYVIPLVPLSMMTVPALLGHTADNVFGGNMITGIAILIGVGIYFIGYKWNGNHGINWVQRQLDTYQKPIPLDVIERAGIWNMLLLNHVDKPSFGFYVCELVEQDRTLDPFLVLVDFNTMTDYYVDVWNEPTFRNEKVDV